MRKRFGRACRYYLPILVVLSLGPVTAAVAPQGSSTKQRPQAGVAVEYSAPSGLKEVLNRAQVVLVAKVVGSRSHNDDRPGTDPRLAIGTEHDIEVQDVVKDTLGVAHEKARLRIIQRAGTLETPEQSYVSVDKPFQPGTRWVLLLKMNEAGALVPAWGGEYAAFPIRPADQRIETPYRETSHMSLDAFLSFVRSLK